MERLLDAALRESSRAEVFEVHSEGTLAHFEGNRLKQVESRQSSSVALRLVRDGRIGFASAGGAIDVERLVQMAVQTSVFGADAGWCFASSAAFPAVPTYDEDVASLGPDTLIGMGRSVIERVTAHDGQLQCEGMVSASAGTVRIANSAGLDTSYRKTSLGVFMEGVRVNGTDMLFVGDSMSSTHLFTDVDELSETILRQLQRASLSAAISTGTYPVLFAPHGVAAALLMPLAVAFNGKNVLEKASRLAGREGERVFDASLTLRDNATLGGSPASAPCDAEGVPSRQINLIEHGVVGEFMYDLQTAALAGVESTGSGRRADARSQVRPGMSAFLIEPGDTTFEEMLSGIEEGLVVEELIGSGQGNLLAGDFGGNVLLGYKVEDGQIVGRVKDTMIAGNLIEVLGGPVTVGCDSRWVGGSLRTPSLLCREVSVSATGGGA